MPEQITFHQDDEHLSFNEWADVPRVGETVRVRYGDTCLYGQVRLVLWYFSTGNNGACVDVFLMKQAVDIDRVIQEMRKV